MAVLNTCVILPTGICNGRGTLKKFNAEKPKQSNFHTFQPATISC